MTTFDDREHAFEAKFAHDEEMAFRAQARRNHDLGLWAAQQLGKSGAEAEAYASSILMLSIDKGGTEAVVAKLHQDLNEAGLNVSDHQLRRRLDALMAKALERLRVE